MIFKSTINKERLTSEIINSNISEKSFSIISSGTSFDICFESELSSKDLILLETIITKHKPIPLENIDTSVTARQMRVAMIMSGISIESIEAAIDSLPEPDKSVASVSWKYSYRFHRDNELVVALAPAIGLTEQDLDNLWALAETL
tara:strand:+ start:122 stop:559 length:438 start_codon:yes stop_codon:yes gene_type:complete